MLLVPVALYGREELKMGRFLELLQAAVYSEASAASPDD